MRKTPIIRIFVGILTISVLLMVFCLPSFAFVDGEALPAYNKYLNQIYDTSPITYWNARLTYNTSSSTTNRFLTPTYPLTYYRYEEFVTGSTGNMITFSPTPYVKIDSISLGFSPDYSNQIYSSDPELVINRYVTIYFRMAFENGFSSIPEAGMVPNITLVVEDPLTEETITNNIESNNTRVSAIIPDEYNELYIFDVSCTFYVDGKLNSIPGNENNQFYKSILINLGDSFRFNMLNDELLDGAITTFQVVSSASPTLKNPSQQTQTGQQIGDIFIQNEEQIQIDIENAKNQVNKKPINDVVDSTAYKQIASMYQTFWDWNYLEVLVILVLTFGLLSFVLFGKKG